MGIFNAVMSATLHMLSRTRPETNGGCGSLLDIIFVIGPVIAVVVFISSSIKGRREFYSKPKPSVDKQLGIVSSYQNHYRQQSHSELRKKRNSAIASEESEPQLGSLASLNH